MVRPAPEDPITTFRGGLKGRGPSSDQARQLAREEEHRREKERAKQNRRRKRR
jgi:hypothetical protein